MRKILLIVFKIFNFVVFVVFIISIVLYLKNDKELYCYGESTFPILYNELPLNLKPERANYYTNEFSFQIRDDEKIIGKRYKYNEKDDTELNKILCYYYDMNKVIVNYEDNKGDFRHLQIDDNGYNLKEYFDENNNLKFVDIDMSYTNTRQYTEKRMKYYSVFSFSLILVVSYLASRIEN